MKTETDFKAEDYFDNIPQIQHPLICGDVKKDETPTPNPWSVPTSNQFIKTWIEEAKLKVPNTYYFNARVRRIVKSQWGSQFLGQIQDEGADKAGKLPAFYNGKFCRVNPKKGQIIEEGRKVKFVFGTEEKEYKGHPYFYTSLETLFF
jgi:hypothetical protein